MVSNGRLLLLAMKFSAFLLSFFPLDFSLQQQLIHKKMAFSSTNIGKSFCNGKFLPDVCCLPKNVKLLALFIGIAHGLFLMMLLSNYVHHLTSSYTKIITNMSNDEDE